MKWLVILNARSPIGAMYLAGSNDGLATDGQPEGEGHPVLMCSKCITDGPYVFVTREISGQPGIRQHIHIPHSAIVAIHHSEDDNPKAFGFLHTAP